MNISRIHIAAVERDTGLSKDVLRVWERRYGFPMPDRDVNGERSYSSEQVERLRLIKRLMDQGYRPGKLIATPSEELLALGTCRAKSAQGEPTVEDGELSDLLGLIKRHEAVVYQQTMQQRLARQGLQSFIQNTVAPLTQKVGELWEQGQFEVFEEHLFTELTKRLLRQVIATLPAGPRSPRILLTSVPEEPHILGLLMLESLLALEGAECIPLGAEMPTDEISRAAKAHQADIVALSFSSAFPQRQIPALMAYLRRGLPTKTALWVGGRGVDRCVRSDGVEILKTFDAATQALAAWRLSRPKP